MKHLTKWAPPEGGGAPLLTMPNVPTPLHGCAPRTVMGAAEWNKMRKACYEEHDETCEICGQKLGSKRGGDLPLHNAHEAYELDYETYTSTFKRLICVCPQCHACIHSGRAITCYLNHVPLYDKTYMLGLAEHAFQLVHKWNTLHPEDEPLRLYDTYLDWVKEPTLKAAMEELIKEYDIELYTIPDKSRWDNAFDKWRMVYNGEEHPSLFKTRADWEATMAKRNRQDDSGAPLFVGKEFDTLRAMAEELNSDGDRSNIGLTQ